MAWDKRGYYYESKRIGKAVERVYLGKGQSAHKAAAQAAAARAKRAADRAELAEVEASLAFADQLDAEVGHGVELLMEATLLSQGLRCHRGEWRRRR